MRVILLQDVKGTGHAGDILEVKDGYGRNYLIPRGLASEATVAKERELADQKARNKRREEKERQEMTALATTLKDRVVEVKARVGDAGRLFGAVTNADVARALGSLGFKIDRKKISLEPLKHVGQTTARIHLYPGIETDITVQVLAE